MAYSKDKQITKYVKGYGFMSFAKNLGLNMVRNF